MFAVFVHSHNIAHFLTGLLPCFLAIAAVCHFLQLTMINTCVLIPLNAVLNVG